MSNLQTKRIALAEANLDQLLTFATINLALDVPARTAKDKTALLALIGTAFTGDVITLIEAPAPMGKVLGDRPARTRIRAGTEGFPPPPEKYEDRVPGQSYQITEVCIQIEVQDKPGGRNPVFLRHNGVPIWVERGKPQWIRSDYIEILDHAVGWEYPENKNLGPHDLGGLDEAQRREVRSYPYQFV